MPAPRMPRDWTAPLRLAQFEPTEMHVHAASGGDADDAPAPAHLAPAPATRATAANASRWHDSATHPAEWVALALFVAVMAGFFGVPLVQLVVRAAS